MYFLTQVAPPIKGAFKVYRKINKTKTRLNMLFIPTLQVKAEFTAMLITLSIAKNAEES